MRTLTAVLFLALLVPQVAVTGDGQTRQVPKPMAMADLLEEVLPAFVFVGGASGVVISEDGLMLTNNHVVLARKAPNPGQLVDVRLYGGRSYKATLLGRNSISDLALLKINADRKFPFVKIGDSTLLEPGRTVVAIGVPFGQGLRSGEPSITRGVLSFSDIGSGISGIDPQGHRDMIQFDASINPGNSGGPLFNMQGELVGINMAILARFGMGFNTGVAYATPTDVIKRFIPHLMKGGSMHADLPPGVRFDLSLDTAGWCRGVKVLGIKKASAAYRAGLRVGDMVVAIDGRKVSSGPDLRRLAQSYPSKHAARLQVRRGDSEIEIPIRLGVLNNNVVRRVSGPTPKLGLGFAPRGQRDRGATVNAVVKGSPSEAAGVKVGDVVVGINMVDVSDVRALRAFLYGWCKAGQTILLKVRRDGRLLEFSIKLPGRRR